MRAHSSEHPHPIDCFTGKRLRAARLMRRMSQSELGKRLSNPITFQQIQKYEAGRNRVAVSRLCEFAAALNVPVSYFLPPQDDADDIMLLNALEMDMLESFRAVLQRHKL